MDAETGRIEAVELTGHEADDGSRVGPLLDRVADPPASFNGDGAYDRADVYGTVAERHPAAAVVVPPRKDAVPSDTAVTAPTRRAGTSGSSPSTAAWAGRRWPATTVAIWPRLLSAATSGWSATRSTRARTVAGRPRSPSASTS